MQDPSDKQNNDPNTDDDNRQGSQPSSHQIPQAPTVDESQPDEPQFEDPIASPSVTGEESPSGDAPDGEPVDIDEQLKSVGRSNGDDDQI